jgi:hypothetical protein
MLDTIAGRLKWALKRSLERPSIGFCWQVLLGRLQVTREPKGLTG